MAGRKKELVPGMPVPAFHREIFEANRNREPMNPKEFREAAAIWAAEPHKGCQAESCLYYRGESEGPKYGYCNYMYICAEAKRAKAREDGKCARLSMPAKACCGKDCCRYEPNPDYVMPKDKWDRREVERRRLEKEKADKLEQEKQEKQQHRMANLEKGRKRRRQKPQPQTDGPIVTEKLWDGVKWKFKRGLHCYNFDPDAAQSLHNKGKSTKEIAEAVGAGYYMICRWQANEGLTPNEPENRRNAQEYKAKLYDRFRELHEQGYCKAEIKRITGSHSDAIDNWYAMTGREPNRYVRDPGKENRKNPEVQERNERIPGMFLDGMTVKQIAETEYCTTATVRKVLRDAGIKIPTKKINDEHMWEMYRAGFTDTEMARGENVQPSTVKKWRQRRGLPGNGRNRKE